ncbi:MAG TPA: hypothetical protein VHT73_15960, partial [Thermodesulfobacteriota bacterium]|nr:hypothetical protein [Thermodesulfobacteriota bacterium]
NEFEEHIRQILPVIKDDKDYENAIREAIERRIGQVHNMAIWSELADIYSEMLNEKLGRRAKKHSGSSERCISFADEVRQYCIKNIIEPARSAGKKEVEIRAGDIHNAMSYQNRMPLVCSAIGAKKFEETAEVERASITGPSNGANAVFKFKVK